MMLNEKGRINQLRAEGIFLKKISGRNKFNFIVVLIIRMKMKEIKIILVQIGKKKEKF